MRIGWQTMRLVCLLSLSPVCLAQPVKVTVVDIRGRGLSKETVAVQFLYEAPGKASPPLNLRTNSEGEALFSIPEAAPNSLGVEVKLTSAHWHCACLLIADMETVVHKGVVQAAPDKAKKLVALPSPEAGRIVFVVRPLTLVEKLLYPLVKE
jgi:hypothetical protein